MMLQKIYVLFAGFLFAQAAIGQDLSLNQILEKHHEAVGYEELAEVESLVLKGHSTSMGLAFPFTISKKLPEKYRMDMVMQGQKTIEAYDGTSAWAINPLMGGKSAPKDIKDDYLKKIKSYAGITSDLYGWEENGFKLELVGSETVNKKATYKLKLTRVEGEEVFYYIDQASFLLVKQGLSMKHRQYDILTEQTFDKYQAVDGFNFLLPFETQEWANGQRGMKFEVSRVEVNPNLADHLFMKPEN